MRALIWAGRAAAVVAIAVSLSLAISARRDSAHLAKQMASLPQAPAGELPQMAAMDLAKYRQLWQQVSDPSLTAAPWVVLMDGKGEFGYLPAAAGGVAEGQPLLMRCLLIGPDGQAVESLHVLLPAGLAAKVALPPVGLVSGEAVYCNVATDGPWASVGVRVGEDQPGAGGVTGRVKIGDKAAEIGQFMLRGSKIRVVLEVVSVGTALG